MIMKVTELKIKNKNFNENVLMNRTAARKSQSVVESFILIMAF